MARSVNGYISCGGYIHQKSPSVTVFGGDTFLTNFCYQNASIFTKNDFNEKGKNFHKTIHVYLPIESTINTYFRNDDPFLRKANLYLQTNPGTINGHAQETAMYAYNASYSVSDGGINYLTGTTNKNISNNEFNRYRVTCTEIKSAGEVIDSWSKAKFANTLDLDSKNGAITKLIEFKNQLYAF